MKNLSLFLTFLFYTLFCVSYTVEAQDRKEVGNMVLEDIPEIPLDITSQIQQYQNARSASFVDWLPNNTGILLSTRFGSTNQLHTIKNAGGARHQITFFDEPVTNGTFCPDPNHNGFIFTKDIGGNENAQLYWYDMITRNAKMISDGTSVNFGTVWSNKGDQFAFTSSRRNQKDFDIYVSSISAPKEAVLKINRGGGYWSVSDWSPDDTKFTAIQYLSSTKSNSFIYDLTTNKITAINDEKSEAISYALDWDSTGENIFIITDEGREFKTLAEYNIRNKTIEYITEGIPWDVDQFITNTAKTKGAFVVNENGFSSVYLIDLKTKDYAKVPTLPIGQVSIHKFHPTKEELAMTLNTFESPGDIYTLNLKTLKTTRWTHSEIGNLDMSTLPKPELITYKSYEEEDGTKRNIPAFVYKPDDSEGPFPVVILIHGGPEAQHKPIFRSFSAFLAKEMGIAVIAPNVRGSKGYGKSYLKLDNGFKRENSVKDIGKLIEWIGTQPEFDKDKIGVYGGSYGGYMVLSTMVNFRDQIKCGIDVVGISNFVTFLKNTKDYRRDLRRSEYGDERDPKMRAYLLSISPTTHADKINKPLFVIQGANDPRVPATAVSYTHLTLPTTSRV